MPSLPKTGTTDSSSNRRRFRRFAAAPHFRTALSGPLTRTIQHIDGFGWASQLAATGGGLTLLPVRRRVITVFGVVGGPIHQPPIHGIPLPADSVKRRQ